MLTAHKILILTIILGIVEVAFIIITESNILFVGIGIAFPIIGFFIPQMVDYVRFRHSLNDVIEMDREISRINNTKLQSNMRQYIDESRRGLTLFASEIKDGMVDLDAQQLERFIKIVFKTNTYYYAIDVSLPSEYMLKNETYLEAHKMSLGGGGDRCK